MLILCYESTANITTQEQLWLAVRKSGWVSASACIGVNRFYIPESLVPWAMLVDSTLRRVPKQDYIV
jgi:hypothetical protein